MTTNSSSFDFIQVSLNNWTKTFDIKYPKKYIGYYRHTKYSDLVARYLQNEPYYPFPSPHRTPLDQTEIIKRVKELLPKIAWTNSYFGWSHCRLCGVKNGNSEYLFHYQGINYVVPHGYFHYLEEHNVKMDDLLLELSLRYQEQTNLPT